MNQKSARSVIIGIFEIRTLATGHIFVMDAIKCLQNVINLKILLLFALKKVYTEFVFCL